MIDFQNEQNYSVPQERLIAGAQAVIDAHEIAPNSSLSVVIVTDEQIQALNNQHRQVDKPTDVLSFPADPLPDDLQEAGEAPYLGDVIIAYPYTKAQSEQEGYSIEDSLVLMVVHGTLHLLGYDHDTPDNRAEMWEAQAEILEMLGINPQMVLAYEEK